MQRYTMEPLPTCEPEYVVNNAVTPIRGNAATELLPTVESDDLIIEKPEGVKPGTTVLMVGHDVEEMHDKI